MDGLFTYLLQEISPSLCGLPKTCEYKNRKDDANMSVNLSPPLAGVDGQRVDEGGCAPLTLGSTLLPNGSCKGCNEEGGGAIRLWEDFM